MIREEVSTGSGHVEPKMTKGGSINCTYGGDHDARSEAALSRPRYPKPPALPEVSDYNVHPFIIS